MFHGRKNYKIKNEHKKYNKAYIKVECSFKSDFPFVWFGPWSLKWHILYLVSGPFAALWTLLNISHFNASRFPRQILFYIIKVESIQDIFRWVRWVHSPFYLLVNLLHVDAKLTFLYTEIFMSKIKSIKLLSCCWKFVIKVNAYASRRLVPASKMKRFQRMKIRQEGRKTVMENSPLEVCFISLR